MATLSDDVFPCNGQRSKKTQRQKASEAPDMSLLSQLLVYIIRSCTRIKTQVRAKPRKLLTRTRHEHLPDLSTSSVNLESQPWPPSKVKFPLSSLCLVRSVRLSGGCEESLLIPKLCLLLSPSFLFRRVHHPRRRSLISDSNFITLVSQNTLCGAESSITVTSHATACDDLATRAIITPSLHLCHPFYFERDDWILQLATVELGR
jgi:hypothetical protein